MSSEATARLADRPADAAVGTIFADLAELFGLSRPAGLCFSAIWRAATPPCADDLVQRLGLARSNISTSVRELRNWGLIAPTRMANDRKDYFTAPADPWEVLRLVLLGRQRHLVQPLADRLIAAEAATPDIRLAAIHAALSDLLGAGDALGALDAAGFARGVMSVSEQVGHAEDAPRKKKKKKKRQA